MRQRIGCDIDGVTTNTYDEKYGFLYEMNKRKGTHFTYNDITTYGMEKIFPITKEELIDIFASLDDKKLELLDPNCPTIIDELITKYDFDLVTAHIPTKKGGLQDLIDRLDELNVHYDHIVFVPNTGGNEKGELAKQYDFMIDDSPYNINAFGSLTNAILYKTPYNNPMECPDIWAYVKNWRDIKKLLL